MELRILIAEQFILFLRFKEWNASYNSCNNNDKTNTVPICLHVQCDQITYFYLLPRLGNKFCIMPRLEAIRSIQVGANRIKGEGGKGNLPL